MLSGRVLRDDDRGVTLGLVNVLTGVPFVSASRGGGVLESLVDSGRRANVPLVGEL